MSDKLADTFGLTPLSEFQNEKSEIIDGEILGPSEIIPSEVDQSILDASQDFDKLRVKSMEAISSGFEILEGFKHVAASSQNNRDVEAYSKLLSVVTKSSKEMLEMHRDMMSIKPPMKIEEVKVENHNTIIFQGTTADFLQMLREKKSAE